jgi:hypothetical protein
MVARADVMRNSKRFTIAKMFDNVLGRTILVILTTATSGTILLLTFLLNQTSSPLPLKYAIVGAVGLIAGFFSRRLLKEHTGLLRVLVSLTAISAGLFLMYFFSFGYLGIDLLYWSHTGPDWDGLIQIGLGTFTACLALYAWRYPKPAKEISPRVPIPSSSRKPIVKTQSSIRPPVQNKSRLHPITRIGGWIKKVSIRPNRTKMVPLSKRQERSGVLSLPPIDRKARKPWGIKPLRRPKILGRHKRHIQQVNLKGTEERRCPFCLDAVIFDDPRGVEICPLCHTHHHADCWEVTGTCQVPHYQD